jgi:sigma-B regulation protein RsbU (phosphoserine phosphatase)
MSEVHNDENARLKRAIKELSILNEIAIQISSLKSIEKIISIIVEKCIKHIEVEQAVVHLLEQNANSDPLHTMIRKIDEDKSSILPIRLNTQLTGWILKSNKPLIVNDLKNDVRFKGSINDLDHLKSILGVPLVNKGKVIGILTAYNKKNEEPFSGDDARLLSIIGSQSAQIIENARLLEEEKALLAVREEIRMASEIQKKLLPNELPKLDGFDISAINIPAKEVGGDYFDFINIAPGKYSFCLGDITGKGLPAAMLMSNLQATFRGQIRTQNSLKDCIEVSNSLLFHSTEADKFATFFAAVIDLNNEELTYCNAGHDNPILIRENGSIERLEVGGLLLGFLDLNKYEEQKINLNKGELLIIFSDGVTEAMDENENEFGEENLIKIVMENINESSDLIIQNLVKELKSHAGKQIQSDDITLIIMKKI